MKKYIQIISCVSLLLFSMSCTIDRTITEVSEIESSILYSFQAMPSKNQLKITDDNEPGEKLLLCLTFVDKESKSKLSNQSVKFYHTSTAGDYEQANPDDESTARLSGLSTTNESGQIYVETILPGDYGSTHGNRHIHTIVFGAKPEAYDIHFKQYASYMLRNFISGSDQHFLVDLKKMEANTLVGFSTIEVKNM